MADEQQPQATTEPPPQATTQVHNPDTKIKLILTITCAILALLSIASSYFFYKKGYKKGYNQLFKQGISNYRKQTEFSGPIFPILKLQANLADTRIPKFITLSLHLELDNESGLSECAIKEAQLRDTLFMLLVRKESTEIDSATEQNKLKRLIRVALNDNLKTAKITNVYFSQFQIGYRIYVQLNEEDSFLNASVDIQKLEAK